MYKYGIINVGETMLVYHGSNVEVIKPIILKKNSLLDFGQGFYTTTNEEQSKEFATKVVQRRKEGVAIVSCYEFDEVALRKEKVLSFDTVSGEWLDFVSANRRGVYEGELYDFVYGPVANDDVFRTIALYIGGALDQESTLKQLKIKELFNQLVFCTDKALSYITFIKSEVVK